MPKWTNSQAAQDTPPPSKPLASWYVQGLSDALGDRLLMFDNSGAASLELLRFRPNLADLPGFEQALREQVRRLGRFRHPAFACVRSVQRLEPDNDLALISNATPGKRLSDVLHRARGPAYASALIKQLAPALALFQQHGTGISHGFLDPDRVVVSPDGTLTIVEQVVGPAVDSLDLPSAELAALGAALPSTDARLGVTTDWYQLGLVAVSVLLGRPVTASDVPHLEHLLNGVAHAARADGTAVSPFVRQWLERALQISGERIESDADARAALDELVRREWPRDSRHVALFRHEPALDDPPRTAAPAAAPDTVADVPDAGAEEPAPSIDAFASEAAEEAGTAPPAAPVQPERPPETSSPAADRVAPRSIASPPSIFGLREAPARQPTPETHVRPPERQKPQASERPQAIVRQMPPPRPRVLDFESRTAMFETIVETPPPRDADRRRISGALVAALALVAVVEAGVIAWMARALWFTPGPPVSVVTSPAGENVLVGDGSRQPAPLQVTVAPNLLWTRVASSASDGILGMALKDPVRGTLRVSSAVPLKILDGTRVLGSVPGSDVALSAGRHEIDLVNEALGFRLRQPLDVEPGHTVSILVATPYGWVTIDASPWAEVSIDGEAIGRTPLGPLPLAIGEHQIAFRNPAGSSDRQRITVKADATLRVVGNLRFAGSKAP